ncbi:MAG: hypothetical protein ABI726_01990 [bacterium]
MKRCASTALASVAFALAGCGGSDDEATTPAACLTGAGAYVTALAGAPDEVLLDGTTPIGDCLPDQQEAGQIASVGELLVAAATELNDQARRRPQGEATVQLGYLVGAVQRAAERSSGIHEDLARRVESAALFIEPDQLLPAAFQQRYEEGLATGRASG